jgi:vitamin B12 transporter
LLSRSHLAPGARALAFLFATAAVASDAPPEDPSPVELPEQVVDLPAGERSADPTGAVTVVPADRYAGEAKAVAELVATAPGVAVNAYGGLGSYATASIRGSTADGVLVLLDGLPLNTAFGGGVNLASIPPTWISSIEIARGAEGAYYGSGALGGAVNVVTRGAERGAWSLETTGGSFGTWSAAADGAARLGGFTAFAAASGEGTDGRFRFEDDRTANTSGDAVTRVRTHNASRRAGALLKLGGPARDGRLDVLAELSGGHRDVPPPVGTSGADWQDDARLAALARLSLPSARPGLSFTGRLQARLDALDVRTGENLFRQRGGTLGTALEASLAHPGGLLGAGVSVDGEALDAAGLGRARTRATAAAWASEDLAALGGRLRLAPALRVERVGAFPGWSAKLGARARLGAGLTARASAGRTFRAPSFAELYLEQGLVVPNPELRPEQGVGGDAGLAWDGAAGLARVTGFATLYRDLIVYDLVSLGRLAPKNHRAAVRGLEVEGATAPARGLHGLALSGAYTLLLTENLRGDVQSVGRELPHRARHRVYARASVAPGPLDLHVEAQYVGRQFQDTRNVLPIPAALLWNAGARLRVSTRPALAVALEVKNALDDRTLRDALASPLPGRTVLLTVRAGATPKEGSP